MTKLKIGITARDVNNIWSNGLDQNIYFIFNMLNDIGYDVKLISELNKKQSLLDININYVDLSNVLYFDLIIEIAHPLSKNLTNYFNSKSKPLISLKLGNNYMIDLETFINKGNSLSEKVCGINLPFRNNQVWISEQFFKFKDYLEVLNRAKVKLFPYIWDSSILKKYDGGFHAAKIKLDKDSYKNIAIVEPNINIIKNSIIPLSICEDYYIDNKDKIKSIYCFNSKIFESNDVFKTFINRLEINKNNISSYEGRYPLYQIFKNNLASTIISCQLLNEQNYIYFETVFYKRPLIHNSSFFKNIGYYYNEYNVKEGSAKLKDCIENFEEEKYTALYEQFLFDHSPKNKNNINAVQSLIEGLF